MAIWSKTKIKTKTKGPSPDTRSSGHNFAIVRPMAKARTKKSTKTSAKTSASKSSSTEVELEAEEAPQSFARHVQPLGPRVLVRLLKSADRLDSGLFLPQGAKDDHAEAMFCEVLEVARTMPNMPGVDDSNDGDAMSRPDLGANVSGIPVGAKVLIAKQHGIAIPWDDTLRLVEVRRILAMVEEISRDELQ